MLSLNSTLQDNEIYTPQYFHEDDVCRLCWCKNADREICPKSSENEGEIKNQLVDKIRYCLDIDISSESSPKKACASCCSHIEKFAEFKSFCFETDKRLCEILKTASLPLIKPMELEMLCPDVKMEKFEDIPLETDSMDSFMDNLETDYDIETTRTKDKVKRKYKPKRSPTYCNICRIDLESKEKIDVHNSELHGVESNGLFKCFGCDKRCKTQKARLSHERNFCKALIDGYKCIICDRYLPNRKMYEPHMQEHRENATIELPEDIFKCNKCHELFKTKKSLISHMAEHNMDKKNYICESCGRSFTRRDYLLKHRLTHSGVKQHVCPHCGFRTTQRSSLTVHIRKHTGERPYVCGECPQRCVSSSNLRAHARMHAGHKRYECSICSKKFGYKVSLDEHVASTHERSQTHACPHCGATYTRARGLKRHLLAKHGKNSKEPQTEENPQTDFYLKIVTEGNDLIKDVTYELKEGETFMKNSDQVFVV